MQQRNRWMALILLIIAALLLVACGSASAKAKKIVPATVEKIAGTELNRLTLISDAAKRLSIQTAQVREQPVTRTRKFGGEIVVLPTTSTTAANPKEALVRVTLDEDEQKRVSQGDPALVLPLARDSKASGIKAHLVKVPALGNSEEAPSALYYAPDSQEQSLMPGQRVFVELSLVGSKMPRKIIPTAAILYDAKGDTWVYTNPEPLVFIRHRISIDYIEGDRAILFAGPTVDTPVVTVGVAELYGTEFGVGK